MLANRSAKLASQRNGKIVPDHVCSMTQLSCQQRGQSTALPGHPHIIN